MGGGSEGGGVTGRVWEGDGDLEGGLGWTGSGSDVGGVRDEGVIVSLLCMRWDQKPERRLEERP